MTININSSIKDLFYIKVLFIRTDNTSLRFFNRYSGILETEIKNFKQNIKDFINVNSTCSSLFSNISKYETKNISLRFTFKRLFTSCTLKSDISESGSTLFINILIVINEKYLTSSNDSEYLEFLSQNKNDFIFIYGINFSVQGRLDEKFGIKWCDVNFDSISTSDIIKNIFLNLINQLNFIFNDNIIKISSESLGNRELTEKELLLNIRKRRQNAEIYLLLGLPISSASYYNLATECMGEFNSDLFEFGLCIQGQIAVLYFYYLHSDYPKEWWEVVSSSLNSFIQELPVPLQVLFQPINSGIFSNADLVFTTQSRKSLLFDFILKRFSLILNLIGKNSNFYNGIINFDVHSQLIENSKFIFFYELILKKARFLLENIVTHRYFNRKIIIEFLDPYINSIYQLSFSIPKDFICNYTIFLLGCAQIFQLIESNRRVGLILIRLSQLFLEHKMFEISYNTSSFAYQWYTSIYCNVNNKLFETMESLVSSIISRSNNCSKHIQCDICNISNNSNVIIGDKYNDILINKNMIDLLDDYYVSNKQYLNNNYIQYLSIYKHDLTLKYSVFFSLEGLTSSENETHTNIHEELLSYLRPFVNSSVCYGIHSMLQTYRKYNVDAKRGLFPTVYPSRYEILSLFLMLKSCISFGCPSRSVSTLTLILEKMVYFPQIYDLEAFKIIQSKCIDNLSILSSAIQFPLIRAPYYSIITSKYRGFTSIESMDITKFNQIKYTTHLLLLFNISCEITSLNTKPCSKCINDNHRFLFNGNEYYCSNCEYLFSYIKDSPWITYQISNLSYYFESQSIEGRDNRWDSLQEMKYNHIKLPILSRPAKASQNSNLFLYNPYEKKLGSDNQKGIDNKNSSEFLNSNVLWQVNKQYTVYVSLFNPFVIPLILDCFSLIIKGDVNCEIYPVSVVVPPTPRFSIPGGEVKIAINVIPKNSGNFFVIGITYKFSGINYINFGSKSLYTNSKNSLGSYLSVFVTPEIIPEISVFWERVEQRTSDRENKGSKIADGKLTIKSSYKFEKNVDNMFSLLNTDILIDKFENNEMINNITLNTITYEENCSITTLELSEIYKMKKIRFLYKTKFKYNNKVLISSVIIDIISKNPPCPKIVSISLIPNLPYSPLKNYIWKTKWEVDKVWLILTIENNSKIFPIEFSLSSNQLNNKIILSPEIKGYRWVINTTLTFIKKISQSSDLILLFWKAFFPNFLIEDNLHKVVATGNLYIQSKIPEFLSDYEFNFEMECNGLLLPNNSTIPLYSSVNIRVYIKSKQVVNENIAIKILPIGDTSKLKQIYLDYSENHVLINSNIPSFSFSIIGLEKKTFEWIVGVEETEVATQKKTLHWKSDLLSISFN